MATNIERLGGQFKDSQESLKIFEPTHDPGEYYLPDEASMLDILGVSVDKPILGVDFFGDSQYQSANTSRSQSVRFRLPVTFRRYTNDESEVNIVPCGRTPCVGSAIVALCTKYTEIQILDDDGQLPRFINIYYGDDDIRFLDGLKTPVTEGAVISIVPAVSGGA